MENKNYNKLYLMTGIHFVIMFIIMYAMVDIWDHVYFNLNKVYMATLMTAPMIIMEIIMMKSMYKKSKRNIAILTAAAVIILAAFISVRTQTAIQDKEFLRSMIPHHSSAILMCEEAGITDPEIKTLCDSIKAAQIREIEQMQSILERLD
ncbi:MAG TPA: DUF305 domain-containing protein [Ignavibacteria bacterium]|nr:DUF305 domain-containing protein [Ignavibacteria bacterium]